MLFKKGFIIVAVVTLVFGLSGCGKKKTEEEAAATQESAKPAVVRGEMVLIPAGEMTMGTDDPKSTGFPKHQVKVASFWIDKYEVTNMDFLDFVVAKSYDAEGVKEGKDWRSLMTPDKVLVPVQYITWNDAAAYCKAAEKRLPTEEEWEMAARGPDGRGYPWGNDWIDGKSNTAEAGFLKPVEIGQFDDVSQFGVHDMLGNVREWTADWYSSYPGNPKKVPPNKFRVIRGLSPNHRGKMAHLWERDGLPPQYLGDVGFRCAKDATPQDAAKASQTK